MTSHARMRAREPAASDPNGDPPDTADIIVRAAAGERAAFVEIVRRYHATIYRWAATTTGDLDEAEDITQMVLIRLHSSLGGYRGRAKFTTWLYRLTRNVMLEQERTRRRRGNLLQRQQNLSAATQVAEADSDAIDSAKVESLVLHYLGALPPRQREVFELADIQGFAPVEIAEMLDVEQVTVRTNLLKARRAIREKMLQEQPQLMREFRQ